MFDPVRYSRDVLAALPDGDRRQRLRELETEVNRFLAGSPTLAEFQDRLYRVIEVELVQRLGHFLGPWEYDCEAEYWGGSSYMDPGVPDELLLRSEFPHGVRLSWGEFVFEPWV
jgi:hypothetical protein